VSGSGRPLPTPDAEDLRASVRDYYTRRLDDATRSGSGCCPPGATNVVFDASPNPMPSFGCGDAHALAAVAVGESVVDLGSGAGLDAFRAAEAVGPTGRVIGVDMTPAMIAHARAAAGRLGLAQVAFREGRIEALPVEDAVADVVISNCVVNLSTDVEGVLREAFRVLRPGGRLRITDTFRRGPAVADPTSGGWCACVDGAHDPATLAAQARRAGFIEVAVVGEPPGAPACGDTFSATLCATRPQIEALAPSDLAAAGALLEAVGLPTQGWSAPTLLHWGVRRDGRWVGVIALERHGEHGLLRSWAVAPDARGSGVGEALLRHALRAAAELGLRSVSGLTTTVPQRLAAAGFREVARGALPAAVHASPELQGACPDHARAFLREDLG